MPHDDDDDPLPDLPLLDGEDDEAASEREDLGLDELIEDADEEVGLDDSSGVDESDPLFALELPPEEDPSDGLEEDLDAIPVEGLDTDPEDGWTEKIDTTSADTTSDEGWVPEALELPSLRPLGHEDHGEEGVEDAEDFRGHADDQVPHLPPLPDDLGEDEEAADDLPLGEDARIEEAELSFEEEHRQMGRALPPRLEPSRCVLEHRGTSALFALSLGEPVLVGGEGLYRLASDGSLVRIDQHGLEGQEVDSVARARQVVVVGTRLGGVFWSEDGGRSFTPGTGIEDSSVAQSFDVRVEADGARFWGRTGVGGIHRSDDEGRTWVGPLLLKPVAAIATPAEGGVVALCAGRDAPPQLVGSEDGAERWAAIDGPPLSASAIAGELHVAVCGEQVAVASDVDRAGPFLSSDGGRTWSRAQELPPTGPMAIVREIDGTSLYASHFFEGDDRGVVVRRRLDGAEAHVVLDVAKEAAERGLPDRGDSEGDHRVYALAAATEGDATIVYAATGIGLFRVRIHPDETP